MPDEAFPDSASSGAALDALLDPGQPLVLFAWLTNRGERWLGPFADDDSCRADCDHVQMGYTALWHVRRVGVWDGTWRWDEESVVTDGNPELVAFERPGSSCTWRGSRFEDPVRVLVDDREPAQSLALCVLERTLDWH